MLHCTLVLRPEMPLNSGKKWGQVGPWSLHPCAQDQHHEPTANVIDLMEDRGTRNTAHSDFRVQYAVLHVPLFGF